MIAVYIGAEPRFGRQDRNLGHLHWCTSCARRYEEFVERMTDLRDDAAAQADAIFPPARLEAQRLQILHRLEHAPHPARVLPFPAHSGQNLSIFTGNQVRRWIAAAAAAGLIIGLTLGRVTDFRTTPQDRGVRVTAPAPPRPVETARPVVEPKPNEEEIFSRAEQAQGRLMVDVLEPLDAITPQPQTVAMTLPPGR
jgi:anti-sigma factor RsiW